MTLKDNIWLGILVGLLAPSLAILVFYLFNYSEQGIIEFINFSIEGKILSPLLSLCAVINLGVFYLFLHFHNYYNARGVILATLLYGVIIVVLKFVL